MAKPEPSTDLRIEYVRISDLKSAPRNPTGHDIPEIDGAIRRFGYIDPIVLDEGSGSIVAGHGRVETLEGMRERGEEPPTRIKVDDDGEWLAPVLRGVDFADEAEAEAYLLAANRVGALGIDDEETLAAMLSDLAAFEGPGLAGTGFDDEDLADLLRRTAAPAPSDGGGGGAGPGAAPDDDLRQIIIPLAVDQYDQVMAALRHLRTEMDVESNTDVILRLISDAVE